ncbi:MAG: TusE/DsrC/DsvC family sulfur relay protein [Bacillota bacterium]|nr:TusE/DsrC/DsvC family sulfur relay protein [Thermanaerosceptrum fracticalcis]
MARMDREGYLVDWSEWDEEVAQVLARDEGIEHLTEKHWLVISFIRNYYEDFQQIPSLRKICTHTGLNTLEIYRLFPSGPVRGPCRIAGLSSLSGC